MALYKAIRNKRFKVSKQANLMLIADLPTGGRLEAQVENCSLTGMGINYTPALHKVF